jgi:predicted HAD superfamily phosphohydrolase YqeG
LQHVLTGEVFVQHNALRDPVARLAKSRNRQPVQRRLALLPARRQDDPLFYDLVITAARCPPPEILFVGDRIDHDVTGPMRAGMRACLVRQDGLRPGELPDGALPVQHVRDLSALVEAG